jgi:hypothetical protein
MKKEANLLDRRRDALRSRLALDGRSEKTVLTFEKRARVYCWSKDRARPVLKH